MWWLFSFCYGAARNNSKEDEEDEDLDDEEESEAEADEDVGARNRALGHPEQTPSRPHPRAQPGEETIHTLSVF